MKYSEAEIKIEQKTRGEMIWLARVAVTSSVGIVHVHARWRIEDSLLYDTHPVAEDFDVFVMQVLDLYPPEYRGVRRIKRIRDAALGALEAARQKRLS